MCTHSKIIHYIFDNIGYECSNEQIVELMNNLHIKVKFDGDLGIFNYRIGADFSNPIVQEARGIIIDTLNWRVVCWPFRKFGNSYESYADPIDWTTASIQEKIDGSIVKLYRYNHEWHWATNSCIYAENARINGSTRTFMDVIRSAANYSKIDYSILDKNKTYIFELVSPETQIVIDYNYPYLYHLGTRSNLTGVEYDLDIGIEQPKRYFIFQEDGKELENVIQYVAELNLNGVCAHEGFVVCDSNFNRIKIKNPLYLELHYSLSRSTLTKKDAVEAIFYKDEEKIEAIKQHPKFEVTFKYYDWQVAKFRFEITQYMAAARNLFSSLGKNRKNFALFVKEDKYSSFAFKAIDRTNDSLQDILDSIPLGMILRYIEDEK